MERERERETETETETETDTERGIWFLSRNVCCRVKYRLLLGPHFFGLHIAVNTSYIREPVVDEWSRLEGDGITRLSLFISS